MIPYGRVECFVRKGRGKQLIDGIQRVELLFARLIPDIVRGKITGIVNEIHLRNEEQQR